MLPYNYNNNNNTKITTQKQVESNNRNIVETEGSNEIVNFNDSNELNNEITNKTLTFKYIFDYNSYNYLIALFLSPTNELVFQINDNKTDLFQNITVSNNTQYYMAFKVAFKFKLLNYINYINY